MEGKKSRAEKQSEVIPASVTLPSELLFIIACYLDVAEDLLSLALVSTRFHRILLARIKEQDNKDATRLLRNFCKIYTDSLGYENDPIIITRRLPNDDLHGTCESWTVPPDNNELVRRHNAQLAFPYSTDSLNPDVRHTNFMQEVKNLNGRYFTHQYHFGKRNGASVGYSDNHQVESIIPFVDDQRQGEHLQFWEHGGIKSMATFVNDKMHGYWATFHNNGVMQQQGWMDHGAAHFNYPGHQTEEIHEAIFKTKSRTAPCAVTSYEEWLEEGWRRLFSTSNRGSKEGLQLEWYEDTGTLWAVGSFKENNFQEETGWYRSGALGHRVKYFPGTHLDQRNGDMEESEQLRLGWHPNGVMAELTERLERDEKPPNKTQEWYNTGVRKSIVSPQAAQYWNQDGEEIDQPEDDSIGE